MESTSTGKITRYRDEIHGDIILDPVAVALLNTSPLQRLGRVYQLGYAHLVYRGATHTRLSHVIGAYHMAGRFVDNLHDNYRLIRKLPRGAAHPDKFLPTRATEPPAMEQRWLALRYLVQWAALLHDVGHIPLGHTLEDEFEGIFLSHDNFRSPRLPAIWWGSAEQPSELRKAFLDTASREMPPELRALGVDTETAYAILMSICLYKEKRRVGSHRDEYQSFESMLDASLAETDEKKRLEGVQREFVSRVRTQLGNIRPLFAPYMVDIVSNTICADYMDYVRRDTANTGLDRQTDDRVLSQFLVGAYHVNDSPPQFRMALVLSDSRGKARLDACTGVVDLVRKRFRLAEIIYYHKTKVSASAMLAKALSRIGKPPEVAARPLGPITLSAASEYADQLLTGKTSLSDLRRSLSPTALLSPEIGDESLLLWLQTYAWEKVEKLMEGRTDSASASENISRSERVHEVAGILRGIGFLQLLVRRTLYKVCAQINEHAVAFLNGISGLEGAGNPEQVRQKLQSVLRLRGEEEGKEEDRAEIERKVAAQAGWPVDSVLIYVPPIKSQAKGIETRALASGGVVTLGEHPAVQDEVNALGKQYARLWRTILLVHPDYQADDLGLSHALDAFLTEVWNIDCGASEAAIAGVARFNYIPLAQREGARLFQDLCNGAVANWNSYFAAVKTVRPEVTLSTREQALRGYLLQQQDGVTGALERISTQYPDPSGVEQRVGQLMGQLAETTESLRSVLQAILGELVGDEVGSPSPARETSALRAVPIENQELSESSFDAQCRAVFRHYIPAEERGRLRPRHREFIVRNKARGGRVRFRVAEALRKYDLSPIPGIATQFNREEGDRTEAKLRAIEEHVDGLDGR